MQAPDSNGNVYVTWPSKNVPHGGIFHTRVAEPSEDHKQLLKVLTEESKLNMKLRQSCGFGLRTGEQVSRQPAKAARAVAVARPHTSRRRSLSAIRSSGAMDVDTFRPVKLGEDRERMKERLVQAMAYGELEQAPPEAPPRLRKTAPKLPSTKEKWNDLVTQIRERAEWLAEMEYLGEAEPHREIVQGQIAERMRALDALGLDSAPNSVRSLASAVNTARPAAEGTGPPLPRASRLSGRSTASTGSIGSKMRSVRSKQYEENVAAYAQLSPLQYSPRRRQ